MTQKNICVPRKYTAQDGTERTTWNTIGRVFSSNDGKTWGVIDTIPVNWDGKFNLFDPKPNNKPQATSTNEDTQSGLPF